MSGESLAATARMGLAFGMSLVAYWASASARPFSASFAVTNRCNLRCSYCNTPFLDPRDLPLERVELLLRRLHALGVRRLGLLGGEPLMRRDIGEIVALGQALGFYVSINSNLNLYARRPEVFDGVDLVLTSLDGDEAAHRASRGERSWDGVLAAIADLVERGKPVIAIAVVNEHSLGHADFLLREAEAIGFQVHFQPQCSDTDIVRGALAEDLSDAKLRAFFAELLAQKRAGRPVASSAAYLAEQARWPDFRVPARSDPGARCAAGRGFLYVDPQGRGYPCAYTKGKTDGVDLLAADWRDAFTDETPCNTCNVGPMLEFNLLFRRPLTATLAAARRIA